MSLLLKYGVVNEMLLSSNWYADVQRMMTMMNTGFRIEGNLVR